MEKTPLYPLKFKPILKHYLWGGDNLARLYPNKIQSLEPVAESWEISDLNGNISVVANGPLAGMTLRELLKQRGEEVLGKEVYKKYDGKFPLLIKLIDAQDQLSLQVHPDDIYAKLHEPGKRGKSEMWYLLEARPGAKLYCGFKPGTTREAYLAACKENNFEPILQSYKTEEGNVFYVPAGTIHSIGKGNILLEVQVASDITYRIYDWGRVDKKTGKPRPLHIQKSEDVLKFENEKAGKFPCHSNKLVESKYFSVDKVLLSPKSKWLFNKNRCHIIFIKKGKVSLIGACEGDVYLIPASVGNIEILADKETVELIHVTI